MSRGVKGFENLGNTCYLNSSLQCLSHTVSVTKYFLDTSKDFAKSHPNGSLGKRLLLKVSDIMHTGDQVPKIKPDQMLSEGLIEISQKSLGMVAIIDDKNHVIGIFTDGDLRRSLDAKIDIHKTSMKEVMSPNFKCASSEMLAMDSMKLLKEFKITHLLITNESNNLLGALNIHDLLQAGIVRSI